MRILRNKILWLTLYAIGITGVFLYLLFPSALVLKQVEAASSASDHALKADALSPSLPLGFKFKNVTVHSSRLPGDVFFQGETLDLQFNPVSLFLKYKTVYFSGKAYGGQFDGKAGFESMTKPAAPAEGKISFQRIDLGQYGRLGLPFFKGMTGTAKGTLAYSAGEKGPGASGKLSVYLTRGAYPLPEPFLGVTRIEFDRGELQAQVKDTVVKVDKFEFFGTQVNCFLAGDIQLADRVDESRLNLKGTLEIAGKNKIKMNVTVGGTLASPIFRYI